MENNFITTGNFILNSSIFKTPVEKNKRFLILERFQSREKMTDLYLRTNITNLSKNLNFFISYIVFENFVSNFWREFILQDLEDKQLYKILLYISFPFNKFKYEKNYDLYNLKVIRSEYDDLPYFVYWLLRYAKNKGEMAKNIGEKNIDKLPYFYFQGLCKYLTIEEKKEIEKYFNKPRRKKIMEDILL